jgi:hypothetical protein
MRLIPRRVRNSVPGGAIAPSWECERQSCPQLIDRPRIRNRMAQSNIEGEILANLPDQSDKAGYGCALTEFLPVENLSRSPNRHRTF